jgi:hypothetical protein
LDESIDQYLRIVTLVSSSAKRASTARSRRRVVPGTKILAKVEGFKPPTTIDFN